MSMNCWLLFVTFLDMWVTIALSHGRQFGRTSGDCSGPFLTWRTICCILSMAVIYRFRMFSRKWYPSRNYFHSMLVQLFSVLCQCQIESQNKKKKQLSNTSSRVNKTEMLTKSTYKIEKNSVVYIDFSQVMPCTCPSFILLTIPCIHYGFIFFRNIAQS